MKRVKSAAICKSKVLFTAVLLSLTAIVARAQDGAAGINEADSQVRAYFEPGTRLMYAIGTVLGLVGAVKVRSIPFGSNGTSN